jgi:Holliday junction resolvase RusA-like endonuclease
MESPLVPGELTISLPLPPISQQARAESKMLFQAEVRKVTSILGFMLSGDISVMVEWSVSQQTRYETDRSPDVDNILKPLIDALVGPSGVMIDDNQVQHVSCHWIDAHSGDESLSIFLRYSPDEWLRKTGLFFVQLTNGLCLPLSRETPAEFQSGVVEVYLSALRLRDKMIQDGVGY